MAEAKEPASPAVVPGTVVQPVAAAGAVPTPSSCVVVYGADPVRVKCIFCNQETVTTIQADMCGPATIASSATICAFGAALLPVCMCCCCWVGCQLVPFCIPQCRDQEHKCGHCGQIIGKKPVMGKQKPIGAPATAAVAAQVAPVPPAV